MVDPSLRSSRLAHVRTSLSMFSGQKRSGDVYTMICCPFHEDRTPSGQVFHGDSTRIPGFFKCLGCGETAVWDKLAPLLGLEPFVKGPPADAFATPLSLQEPTEAMDDEDDLVLRDLPEGKQWRGFPTRFLRKVGVKCSTKWNRTVVWLPVYVGGQLKGHIWGMLRPQEDFPSYLNKKGSWSKTYGLFPFDYAIKVMKARGSTTMALVEGPRDALRFLRQGIPCVALLGTQSWTAHKVDLLELHGVETLVDIMDGDAAGIAAHKLIVPDIKRTMNSRSVKLWSIKNSPYIEYVATTSKKARKRLKDSLWDPGNIPQNLLDKIEAKYWPLKE